MREKLYGLIHDFIFNGPDVSDMNLAEHLIANGVTIPVRCKDCKHYEQIPMSNRAMCTKFLGLTLPKPEDFCPYGERKDNG